MVPETAAAFRPVTSAVDPRPPGSAPGADEATDGPWGLIADAISDDLRSSLALVAGYRQSLELLTLDASLREQHVDRLVAATGAVAQVATDVLDLVRAIANPPGLARQPVSVAWLAERLRRSVARGAEADDLELDIPHELPMVEVDPAWIGHALRILAVQARRHPAAAGGVTVHAHGNPSTVVITIWADRPQVGTPARLPRPLPGRGVGGAAHLALCRQIVESNGGGLRLDESDERWLAAVSLPALRSNQAAPARRPR
jgi:K+-sensing histidine kinase KdpD